MKARAAVGPVARFTGSWRALPFEAILIGIGLFAILAAFVGADPSTQVTASTSPFTDEAFNTVNARNLLQFGSWSTDQWNLNLVNLPFSLLEAIWFRLVGVGIVQARLIAIACVSLCAAAITGSMRGVVGRRVAVFAGLAFATNGLVLVYGRMAFLEDLVLVALTLGTLALARDDRLTGRWGLVSGICYGVAIGTKPSAAFAVFGVFLAVVILAYRDKAIRRWAVGAGAAIALTGAIWAVFVWLPNRDAVAMDLKIWAPIAIRLAPADAVRSIGGYFVRDNDHVFGSLLGPLAALGAAGIIALAALRHRIGRAEARLALVSIGWLSVGFAILLVASYRPNRYVVPLVPPLAILAALGLNAVLLWLRERTSTDSTTRSSVRRAAPALVLVVTLIAVAPGLISYGSWARTATYNLPDIQARFAAAVPDGARVAGRESALFLMRSKAVTLITQPVGGAANAGDLYVQGVRLYVVPIDDSAPPGVPAATWAARQKLICGEYGGVTECLFRVP
jgi:4-amino-4-deoxy-L-arabinose transferase-like glycosyltransferase